MKRKHSFKYQPSSVIKSLEISPERLCLGHGDNWPITWGADDAVYTVYCDGQGFDDDGVVSQGIAVIEGVPPSIAGRNTTSPTGKTTGGGTQGLKACGLLMVDGVLYMWVRNLKQDGTGSTLAWSADRAATWTWADWDFPEIGYPVWLNAGRDYEAAQDDYAYMYSPDTPSAYVTTGSILLTRVPRDRIRSKDAYEFFAGLDEEGNPDWTTDFADRKPGFEDPGHCFRPDVVYNPFIGRYLLCTATSGAPSFGGTEEKYLGIFDAPSPWGPWTVAKQISGWSEEENRFHPRIPTKWIEPDGKRFYLSYSCFPKGSYRFNLQRCTVETYDRREL